MKCGVYEREGRKEPEGVGTRSPADAEELESEIEVQTVLEGVHDAALDDATRRVSCVHIRSGPVTLQHYNTTTIILYSVPSSAA